MDDATRKCIGPECSEPAARGDLCWGHLKQRERGQTLRPIEKLTPEEVVIRAGSEFLEAEGDEEYDAARARFLRASERWLLSRGWRPPLEKPAEGGRKVVQLGLGFEVRARRRA
jgi:hypothetical protein